MKTLVRFLGILGLFCLVNGLEIPTKTLENGCSVSLSGNLSGEVIIDGRVVGQNGIYGAYFDIGQVFDVSAEVYQNINIDDILSSSLMYKRINTSEHTNGFSVATNDLGVRMDFWPTFTSSHPTVKDTNIHDMLLPEKWSLLLIFGSDGEKGSARSFLRSYAMKASFATHNLGVNQTKVWATSTGSGWRSNKYNCEKSEPCSNGALSFASHVRLFVNNFCGKVIINGNLIDCLQEPIHPHRPTPFYPPPTKKGHTPGFIQYMALYLLQIFLLLLIVGFIVLLVARLMKQWKERQRMLSRASRVSYIFANHPPVMQIIPTNGEVQTKDISQIVFH